MLYALKRRLSGGGLSVELLVAEPTPLAAGAELYCEDHNQPSQLALFDENHLKDTGSAKRWEFYLQLNEVEQAFEEHNGELELRPIYHQLQSCVEVHVFVSFVAYPLQVTLKARLRRCAGGLTPRAVLEKFACIQMLDVHLPTADGREIVLGRYAEPER